MTETRHPVWALWGLCAAAILGSLVVLALGPRGDGLARSAPPLPSPVAGASPVASPGASPVAGQGPQELAVQVGDYSFQPSDLTVRPGEVTVVLSNVAGRRHTWLVQDRATGADLATADMRARESTTVTFTAPAPGSYRIYCNITDHAERGQVGTLTVARS